MKASTSAGRLLPSRPLVVVVALLVVLSAAVGWLMWRSYDGFQDAHGRHSRLQELTGVIAHLDEVLTMSARMGAATGDLAWETRYNSFEPELDAAIKETELLAPYAYAGEGAAQTNAANMELVDMELRAFDLVRAGEPEAAMSLLFSPEYEEQERIYAEGNEQIAASLHAHGEASVTSSQRRWIIAVVAAAVLVVLAISLAVLLSVNVTGRKRAEEALRATNESLEDRVAERTQELEREIAHREEVQETQARLGAMLEATPDFVGMADGKGRVVYVNRAGRLMVGAGPDDDLSRTEISGYHPAWTNALLQEEAIPTAVREGTWAGEAALLSRDGREIPVSLVAIAHKSPDGSVKYLSTISRDISDRRQAEEALQESENKYRHLVETVAAAAFIFQGTEVRYVNSTAETMTGYTREELLAMDFWDMIHPDFQELVRERGLARQQDDQVPRSYEVKILTKGGEECWVDFTAGPIEFEGKPAVLGTAFDVTERKRAEEELRLAQERLQHLVSTSPAVIYSAMASGDYGATFISENVTAQMGYESHEFIENPDFWISHVHPEDAARVLADLQHVFQEGQHAHEYRFLHKDGDYRWMQDQLRLVRDAEGNPLEMVGCWIDITERKRAVDELQRRTRDLGERVKELSVSTASLTLLSRRTLRWPGSCRG